MLGENLSLAQELGSLRLDRALRFIFYCNTQMNIDKKIRNEGSRKILADSSQTRQSAKTTSISFEANGNQLNFEDFGREPIIFEELKQHGPRFSKEDQERFKPNRQKLLSLSDLRPSENKELASSQSGQITDQGEEKTVSGCLKKIVMGQHIFEWRIIAEKLECSKQKAIRLWQQTVYPAFSLTARVAGSTKWSKEQDSILFSYVKQNGLDLEAILVFLPKRSTFSIQGRWRRICKNEAAVKGMTDKLKEIGDCPQRFMEKHQFKKYIIQLIAKQNKKIGANSLIE